MKKLIIIGLIAVASMVFTGCKDNENEDKKAVSDQVEDSVTDNTDAEDITDMADGSIPAQLVQEGKTVKFIFQRFPLIAVQPMNQVKIDVIRFQPGELLLEHGSGIIIRTFHP